MNRNIFRVELRLYRRNFLLWTVVIALITLYMLAMFPYYRTPEIKEALQSFPEQLLSAFNMSEVMFEDFNSWQAGLSMSYVFLLTSIYALILAGSLIAKDSDLRTAEFLFTKPVSRAEIMLSKVAVFLVFTLTLWVIIFLVSVGTGLTVACDEFDLQKQFLLHAIGFLATLAAGGLGFMIAPFIDQTQATTSLGVGIALVSFILNSISNLTEGLTFLQYFTIYYYASFEQVIDEGVFVPGMIVLLVIFLFGTGLGLYFLKRKEFTA